MPKAQARERGFCENLGGDDDGVGIGGGEYEERGGAGCGWTDEGGHRGDGARAHRGISEQE